MDTNIRVKEPKGPVPSLTHDIQQLKEFRLSLDRFMNSIKLLQPSREVSLCYTALQRSFHWLGKSLQETGSLTPYANNENQADPSIEQRAEQQSGILIFDECPDQTAKVKYFRKELQEYITAFNAFQIENKKLFFLESVYLNCLSESKISVMDAKMWLGWELGRIRDSK